MSARRRLLLAPLAPLLLAACDATSPGREEWRAGRHAEALAAFRRAADDAGDDASPQQLLFDVALAALRTGDLELAEQAAVRSAARGGEPFEGLRDFVRGSVSFSRSERAEAESTRPDADPTAPARAATHAEDALARWRVAAASRADWPEARRNVERALLRLDRLREKRRDGAAPATRPGRDAPPGPDAPPLPQPPEPPVATPPGGTPKEEGAAVEAGLLPAAEVPRLFGLLLEKEREKRATRRAVRSRPTPGVERDW